MRAEVDVGNTITEICPATESISGHRSIIQNLVIKNTSTTVVYLQWTIEDDDLTQFNGYPLGQNEVAIIERTKKSAPVLGITGSGTATLRVSGD